MATVGQHAELDGIQSKQKYHYMTQIAAKF